MIYRREHISNRTFTPSHVRKQSLSQRQPGRVQDSVYSKQRMRIPVGCPAKVQARTGANENDPAPSLLEPTTELGYQVIW